MSTVVLFKDGHLGFCKDVVKPTYNVISMPLEAWVCREGLVIPLSTSSYGAVRVFNGDTTGVLSQVVPTTGILLRLDGSLCHFNFNTVSGKVIPAKDLYSYELSTEEGVFWSASEFASYEEKGYAALLLGTDREDVLKLLVASDLFTGKFVKWYKLTDLIKFLKDTHKKKFPESPLYNVEKSFAQMMAKIEVLEYQLKLKNTPES